ncbi:MAG: hypothetical protein HFH77_15060, partial [Lachnospiraceae bacterium]|nr:hypothetical protein [Lachnospiraceae bacterium]
VMHLSPTATKDTYRIPRVWIVHCRSPDFRRAILTITQGDNVRNAALHAGFVQILPQEITILAEIIEWPAEIDEARANAARQRAEGRLAERGGNIDVARAEAALMRSIARINAVKMK